MNILIITQKVNYEDPVMGFFHRWIVEFAKKFEKVTVICLEKGKYDLPSNVKVLSLGKEEKQSRKQYLARFYSHVWHERKNYDVVLSHMNQEYILLAGLIWKILGKRVFMWRNHHAGDELTDMSAVFCNKIFCTSKYSYTMKFGKTHIMPVGIDTETFHPSRSITRVSRSILFLGRIAPVKKVDLLIDALKVLKKEGISFTASIYGDATIRHHEYYVSLVNSVNEAGLAGAVSFHAGIPNADTVAVYSAHDIFVNLSSSGMYDKTIFEAMAAGAITLSSNENLRGEIDERLVFKEGSCDDLVSKLKNLLALPSDTTTTMRTDAREYVIKKHSLSLLIDRLIEEMLPRKS